jgi:uroporphyrinogen-III decarboxylase
VPYEQELARAVRAEGGFIYTHTCGAISDRLEAMMDCGINGLECLDPPPLGNVDLSDAIQRTKGRIFIKGNIDSVHTLLNKDREGVRKDVQRTVEAAAPGGGYICSTACSVAPYVKPDNIKEMVEVARSFRY